MFVFSALQAPGKCKEILNILPSWQPKKEENFDWNLNFRKAAFWIIITDT